MKSSNETLDQLKLLTNDLGDFPTDNRKKVSSLFEAVGGVIKVLTDQNKQQEKLLADREKLLKEQEKLIREQQISESKYRIVFENSLDAIFLMQHDIYIKCNKKALEMFECNREDIEGVSPAKFSPVLQPDGTKSEIGVQQHTKAAIAGYPQCFKWRHSTKRGIPFNVWVRLNKIEMNGGSWFIACLHKIIKRRKEVFNATYDFYKHT